MHAIVASMKVEWYTNACVRISASNGANILCDPWISGGAFLGSWFHWPPIENDLEASLLYDRCDGIYVSHLHPDHYDPKFLSKFSRLNPGVPIYLAEFAHSWLKRSVLSVVSGKSKVIEVPSLTEVTVAPGITLKIFAADTCNPKVCGTNIPCQVNPSMRGIDSIGVFAADGRVVVNANDAMGVRLVPRIAANIGTADLIMGHYGGASPFPQCFPEVEDKKEAGRKVIETACGMLASASDMLHTKYIMPFAGQYVLGGRLVTLNEDRATLPLDQAAKYIRTIAKQEVITMKPGGFFDLNLEEKSSDYVEPDSDASVHYLERIAKAKFSYEKSFEESWMNADDDLVNSAKPVAERSRSLKLSFQNSFVIGDGQKRVTINLDPSYKETSIHLGKKPLFENITEISMPPELLRRLSTRKKKYKGFTPLHWNQADVGSHFTWKRVGNYDLASHSLLNFYGV